MDRELNAPLGDLEKLLVERLEVIADHAWRDRDAAGHLERLKQVSEALVAEHERLRSLGSLPPRLQHYLTQCSYSKALDWLRGVNGEG